MQPLRQSQRLIKSHQDKNSRVSISNIESPSTDKPMEQTKKSKLSYAPDVDFQSNSSSKTKSVLKMKERIITPVKDINPMIANMAIKGRCISVWHSYKLNEIHDPYSLDCVFQDEESNRIQIFVKKELMFKFEPLLREGQCYIISYFRVVENSGRLLLLPNRWKISFYKGTKVTRIEQIDDNFIGFVNEPFTRILDTNNEYHEHDCVDVIGTVVSIGNIVPANGYGCSKSFRKSYEANTGYNASEFKIEIHNPDSHVVTPADFMQGCLKKMIGMIRDIEPVTPIPTKGGSSSRNKKQLWHCKNHGETYAVVSRFKIIVGIFDESSSAQVVIFDNNVYKMTKLSAWEIMEEQGVDANQYFPDNLNQIIRKQYLFKIKYSKFNHNNNSLVYRAKKVTKDVETINYFKNGFVKYEDKDEDYDCESNEINEDEEDDITSQHNEENENEIDD
ncbi:replication protein A 70 kDa DNA-binding subunit B [Tanacetum coccineum]